MKLPAPPAAFTCNAPYWLSATMGGLYVSLRRQQPSGRHQHRCHPWLREQSHKSNHSRNVDTLIKGAAVTPVGLRLSRKNDGQYMRALFIEAHPKNQGAAL